MALKVVKTVYNIFFNNSTKKMWKKIKWDKYNRFKKVKSEVALNNLHIWARIKLDRKWL